MRFQIRKRLAVAVVAAAAGLTLTAGVALASTGALSTSAATATAPPAAKIGCVVGSARSLVTVYENVPANFKCPSGFPVSLSVAGPKGATGATGQVGPTGPTGAKGSPGAPGAPGAAGTNGTDGKNSVLSSVTTDLGGVITVNTGGSFASRATLVGTVTLPADGTYLVSVDAKATPDVSSDTAVLPMFAVYDGPALDNFSNNLFNTGSGALATDSTSIDSYFDGTNQIVVTGGNDTLDLYAFGYSPGGAAGTYTLDDLTVTATQLDVAS